MVLVREGLGIRAKLECGYGSTKTACGAPETEAMQEGDMECESGPATPPPHQHAEATCTPNTTCATLISVFELRMYRFCTEKNWSTLDRSWRFFQSPFLFPSCGVRGVACACNSVCLDPA